MYQLVFYVPEDHCEPVKEALFAAGAGRYPGYDRCAWQTAGQGQFLPLEGSVPFLGTVGRLQRIPEIKVEMICENDAAPAVLAALKAAHPYEAPAFAFFSIDDPLR